MPWSSNNGQYPRHIQFFSLVTDQVIRYQQFDKDPVPQSVINWYPFFAWNSGAVPKDLVLANRHRVECHTPGRTMMHHPLHSMTPLLHCTWTSLSRCWECLLIILLWKCHHTPIPLMYKIMTQTTMRTSILLFLSHHHMKWLK